MPQASLFEANDFPSLTPLKLYLTRTCLQWSYTFFKLANLVTLHPRTPAIIDVEASGFGAQSYPIEVGVVLPNGERFCRLIKPLPSWQFWDQKAQALHHISRQQLQEHGEEAVAVCLALNEFAQGLTLYSDGWVVDHPWLVKLFAESGVHMAFSVSSLEMMLSEPQMSIWDSEKSKVIASTGMERHRASADAFIIQQTYQRTRELMLHSH